MPKLIAPLCGVLAVLCACQGAEQSSPPDVPDEPVSEGVVAQFAGGEITDTDVDAHILKMPADERPAPGADLEAWYGDLIRTLVLDRTLLKQARDLGLQHGEDFRLRRIAIERQLGLQTCLAELRPESTAVPIEDLQQAFAVREEQFRAPERRSTFHIYLRRSPDEHIEVPEAEMLAIRERILSGENFQRVARAESDSERRHQDGRIGWVRPGELPPAFEKTVFALSEGVPSQPVVTPDGVHLFQVDDIVPERRLSWQEVAPALRSQLQAERFARAIDEVAAMNPAPTAKMVDRQTLDRMAEAGAEQEAVLLSEDYTLSLREFRQRLEHVLGEERRAAVGPSTPVSSDPGWRYLERLNRQEAAYEYCKDAGLIGQEALDATLSSWEERAMVGRMRQQLLLERVLENSQQLELYYQSNIGQFTPPLRWKLRRLRITYDSPAEGRELMARLEQAAMGNETELEALKQELGGELEALGWMTLEQMQWVNLRLPKRVSALQTGALVAPLHREDALELFQVTGRKQFEPRPFEDVKEEVASAYLRQYTSEIYDQFEADLLERIEFELYTDRLQQLRDVGLSTEEITVERLDALLSES